VPALPRGAEIQRRFQYLEGAIRRAPAGVEISNALFFNTSKVRLEEKRFFVSRAFCSFFNTSKVRLEEGFQQLPPEGGTIFNTSKVRLEVRHQDERFRVNLVFNTSKVRLEAVQRVKVDHANFDFQYLEGAIRRRCGSDHTGRESLFQYLEGAIRSFCKPKADLTPWLFSIPRRCD